MFSQVHSPRNGDFVEKSNDPLATKVPDHQLVLKFTRHKNILPRLSAKLDSALLQNIKNRQEQTETATDSVDVIDPIEALGLLPETNQKETKQVKKKSVPRSKRHINYGKSKADLTRGIGVYATGPSGQRIRLDQYGGQIKRRRHKILELRGHLLGDILADKQDKSRFLVLRDFQMPEIIARWQKYFLRAVLRVWHNVVVLAKEDMLRYRKMFIKSDRELKKRVLKVFRHEADKCMSQRANSQLNNHSIEDEEKNQKIRDLSANAKKTRAQIVSLELQNDSLVNECDELKQEVKRLMEKLKGKQQPVATIPKSVEKIVS